MTQDSVVLVKEGGWGWMENGPGSDRDPTFLDLKDFGPGDTGDRGGRVADRSTGSRVVKKGDSELKE